MKNLIKANNLIEKICKEYPQITPITQKDYDLFQKFFQHEPHTYGNSWTYITQGMYGIGKNNLGYKYFDGNNLSAVCIYPKIEQPDINVLFWIRPMGKNVLEVINQYSKQIYKKYNLPVYVKKIFKRQFAYLHSKGFKTPSKFPWHTKCPMEDDTYPEQILELKNTIITAGKLGKTRQLNRSYRYYLQLKKDPEIVSASIIKYPKEAKQILTVFFEEKKKNDPNNVSKPNDYFNLIEQPLIKKNILEKILFKKDLPLALYFIEKQNQIYASQYAMISLRKLSNHIVDFLMFDMFYQLLSGNIVCLNLGGSEKVSLNDFKKKFRPVKENRMYWAALY